MRRILVPIALLAAMLAAPASGQAFKTGFSEQQAAMFTNPLFAPLGTKIARYIAPYDAMSVPEDRAKLDAWLNAARAAGVRPLVSFYHSRVTPRKLPSLGRYRRQLKAFFRAHPDVKDFSPWNEANHEGKGRFANPSAKRAAQYYEVARSVCRRCKLVGLDVLDSTNIAATVAYIRSFKRYVRKMPRIWGLHNYSDTNRFRNKGTKAVLKAVPGEVWLTETGGIVRFSRSFPYDEARAARALRFMFKLARSNRRLKRLYIYQWTGSPAGAFFDAGIIGADGRPRPGYEVVRAELARRR